MLSKNLESVEKLRDVLIQIVDDVSVYKSILEDEDADKLDEEAPAQGTLVPVHNNNNSLPNNNNISVNVENGTAGAGSNQVEPPKKRTVKNDTYFSIASQVVFPYMVAGVGMVFAGLYLHNVQDTPVYHGVSEIMILCQSLVVGFMSASGAIMVILLVRQEFIFSHNILLLASSLCTAAIASSLLGFVTCFVAVSSRMIGINPDNIATPISATLGDLVSLTLLSNIASLLYNPDDIPQMEQVCICLVIFFLILLPIWFTLAYRNKYTQSVLYHGWFPVLIAMGISSVGGLIFDQMVKNYNTLAMFQPLINGVGGNLVSIQSSRISTSLHIEADLGTLPPKRKIVPSVCTTFCGKTNDALAARVLLTLLVFGQLSFLYVLGCIQADSHARLNVYFVVAYITASIIQLLILLYLAPIFTHIAWLKKINPDNAIIPVLTALGDLLGIMCLACVFWTLDVLHL
ncbi:hypothetical protein M8J76_006505 [Diaphorina citri]|nr:hypothetical protein M8J76_006505 [Diaphorina citri]